MTVDEAKLKWCCTHKIEKCLADECMAWRWNYERVDTEDELVFETVLSITDGYCGLAGKEGAE
jgi:hypothetical protein